MTISEENFAKVCAAARANLRTALDLIAIHAEQPVRGEQPRASLNPFTVLAAVAAWERFIADLAGAVKQPEWQCPGHYQLNNPKGLPKTEPPRV